MVFRQVGNDTDNLINKLGLLNKSFADIKRDFQNGQGLRSLGNFISNQDVENFKKFNSEFEKVGFHKAFNDNLATSHSYIQKQAVAIRRLNTEQYLLKRQFREGKITQEQYDTALQSNQAQITALTTKTQALTLAQKASAIASKAAVVALNMLGNIAIMAGINLIITGITKLVNKQKELREEIENNAESAKENIKNISDLYLEYRKLSEEFKTNKNVKDELSSTTDSLLEALGYEKTQIDELTKGYQNLDDAINKATLDSLKKAADSLNLEVGEKFKELQDTMIGSGVGVWDENTFTFKNTGKQSSENLKMLKALKDAQIANTQFYDSSHQGNVMGINIDTSTIEGMQEALKTYEQIIDTIRYNSGLSAEELGLNTTFQELVTRYTNLDIAINNYSSALKNYNDNIAQQVVITSLIGKEIPKTQEAFEQYKQDLINSILSNPNNQFIGTASDIETAINYIIGLMPEFAEFTSNTNSNFDDTTNSIYNLVEASDDLQKSLDDTFSNQSTIQSAFDKIQEGSSLSADEVRKLIELCPQLATEFVKTADGYTIGADKLINANDEIVQSTKQSLQERADYLKQFINTDYDTNGIDSSYEAKKYNEWQQSVKSAKTELEGLELVLSMFGITLEDTDDKISDLTKSTSNLVGKAKTLSSAFAEQKENGKLSADTVLSLIENGYSAALMYDKETGAIKLNTQAYLDLAKAEIQKQRTEIEIAKNDTLQSKLDAERSIVSNLGWEYLETSKAAIEFAKAKELINNANADLSNYDAQIAALNDLENSLGVVTEGLYGDNSKEKPQSVLDFEKEYARRQHEINMGRMSEDEDYYKWLESASKTAFEGLTDYQDDLWKYEEEVYKGRKQLLEDYYDTQQKYLEDRIDSLETQVDVTLNTSKTSDGTELNTKEKYEYIKDTYQEIINEIETFKNEIINNGIEGHEELVAELEKQVEEYQQKIEDTFKTAVEEEKDYIEKLKDSYIDSYDERIDKIKEQKEAAEEAIQAEIDALKKVNDEKQRTNDLEKAKQKLENAKKQRTRAVLGADGTMSYQVDQDKIDEAQKEYDEALLENQIAILEEQKEIQSNGYDTLIENLENEQEAGERRFDILLKVLDEYLNPDNTTSNSDVWSQLAKMQGAKYENGTWYDKDGKTINVESLVKSAETKTDDKKKAETDNSKSETDSALKNFFTSLEKRFNLDTGSLTLEKVQQAFGNSISANYNPYGAMNEKTGLTGNGYTSYVNNENANITSTFNGDIIINNPVGNSNDLAQELIKNLPSAINRQTHKS